MLELRILRDYNASVARSFMAPRIGLGATERDGERLKRESLQREERIADKMNHLPLPFISHDLARQRSSIASIDGRLPENDCGPFWGSRDPISVTCNAPDAQHAMD